MATPACPIITNQFQAANGTTIDNSATGWSLDSSNLHTPHPSGFFFAVTSNRFTATNLGGVGIINSKVFSIAGYMSPQASVKITAEGKQDSLTEYVEFYYRLDGGPLVLVAHQKGNFGTLTFTSPVLKGNTIQLVIKIYDRDNGSGTKSNYYVERYDVFQTNGPCTPGNPTITVTPVATNGGVLTCTKTSTTLSATSSVSGVSYFWSGPGFSKTSTSATPSVSVPGTDTLIVTTATAWGTALITVTKDISSPINVTATNSNALTCSNTITTLTGTSGTAGATFAWSGPSSFSATGATATTGNPGLYTVKATHPTTGCTATASTTVVNNISKPAGVTASVDSVLTCKRTTVNLSATTSTPGVTYAWSTPEGNHYPPGTVAGLAVHTPGTYTVTVTDTSNGCTSTGQVTVLMDSSPPDSLRITPGNGVVTLNCITPTINLTASSSTPDVSYTWVAPDGTTSTGANIVATMAGVYNIYTANPANGCQANINVTVISNFIVPATPTITGNTPLTCTATQVNLIATGPDTSNFNWTGPGNFTSSNGLAIATVPGTYVLTATNTINGCSSTASATVLQNITAPGVRSTANPASGQITCAHPNVILTGSSTVTGVTFGWTGPNSYAASGAAATIAAPGIYTVTATDPSNGCVSTATGTVTRNINAPIGVTAGTSDVISCFTPSVFVTGSTTTPGATFSWTGPDGFTASTDNAEADEPGTYTLTVTNPANGCTTTATAVVEDNSTPPAGVTATNSGPLNCINTSAILTGSSTTADAIYTWVAPDNSLIQGASTSITVAGTYTLVATDPSNGCASTATTTVAQNTTGCAGSSAQSRSTLSGTGIVPGTDTTQALAGSTGFEYKAYPNPFSDRVFIEFKSPESSLVTVEIYNNIGVRQKILFNSNVNAHQSYKLELNKGDLSLGTYFCIIRSSGKIYSAKLILVSR